MSQQQQQQLYTRVAEHSSLHYLAGRLFLLLRPPSPPPFVIDRSIDVKGYYFLVFSRSLLSPLRLFTNLLSPLLSFFLYSYYVVSFGFVGQFQIDR